MTKKDLIVDFVALHGKDGARFVDIQKFIFEHNNPGEKYDWWKHRGYYCRAFSGMGWNGEDRRYLLKGDTCLVKLGELYFAKRDGKILHQHEKQEVVWEN